MVYSKYMRLVLGTLLVSAFVAFGQPSPEMTRAQQDISRLRDLVAAGAIAPARLQEAEATLDDARDADILQRTLYGKLTAQDLTPEQSTEMVQAAKRRFDRQKERIGRIQKLVDAGVIAKGELGALEEELENTSAEDSSVIRNVNDGTFVELTALNDPREAERFQRDAGIEVDIGIAFRVEDHRGRV